MDKMYSIKNHKFNHDLGLSFTQTIILNIEIEIVAILQLCCIQYSYSYLYIRPVHI